MFRSSPLRRARTHVRPCRPLSRALWLGLALALWPKPARAYVWMIRHGYTQCAQCHVDPSGSGALTRYGHVISESLLRTHYRWERQDDASKLGNFLFGALELPEQFDFGGDVRVLSLHSKVDRVALQNRFIWMQLEGKASLADGPVVASATLGYAPEGALGAALSRNPRSTTIVSREHWLGLFLDAEHTLLLRAGRMNLPFGLRSIEHTLWVRADTGTDIDDQQQFGVAATLLGDLFRAEIMAIAGSFQVRPDVFRQRGYSAYVEYDPLPRFGVGLSSRVVHLELDPRLIKEEWKHAHGVFGRWATEWEPLVLLAECDYVFESPKFLARRQGVVGYLQADFEATQGVHFLATVEASDVSTDAAPLSFGGWLSYAWFFAPHADLRLDDIYQSFASNAGRTLALSFLVQVHLSL